MHIWEKVICFPGLLCHLIDHSKYHQYYIYYQMKVLIIGGTGFIGRPLTRLFVENHYEVSLFHRNKLEDELNIKVKEIIGSRNDILKYRNEFLSFGPDLVIDAIAYAAQDIWALQKAIKGVSERLVLLSSADVYKATKNE